MEDKAPPGRLAPDTDEQPSDETSRIDNAEPGFDRPKHKGEKDLPPIPEAELKGRCIRAAFTIVITFIGFAAVVAGLLLFVFLTGYGDDNLPRQPDSQTQTSQIKYENAVAYNLHFPALYPDISSEPSSECRTAWDALTSVPCHDKLFSRAHDNGTRTFFRWDTMYYLPKIC